MFSCAHEAFKKLSKDKRFVGSTRIGFLAVLHTWGSMLQYHPHIHLVISGGAVSEKGDSWLSSRQDLFVHTKPLALKGHRRGIGASGGHRVGPSLHESSY
jgi:hypothetical protein